MKLSSIPFAALCFGLVFGGAVATSCGPSKPACTPTSCNGCCDSTSGLCVSLTTANQCGTRGETCKACSLGQSCSFGTCSGGNNTGAGTSGGGFGGSSGGGFATGGGSSGGGFAGGGSSGGGFATGGGSSGGGFATGGGSSGGGLSGGGSAGGGLATGGGTPSCNSGNCSSGCCQGTQCIQPPNNSLNTQCGFAGFACANCVNSGQVCNSVTFSCMSGTGGGGAGGGGVGGGSGQLGDACNTVVPLTLFSGSASTSGSLFGYVNDTTACSGAGPDAVYSVTLNAASSLTAQVSASGFTPRVSVRSTCTSSTTLACDSVGSSGFATATTSQLAAGTYFVWVDSSSSTASGSYSLTLTASGAGGGGAGGGGVGGGFAGGTGGGGATSGTYAASSIAASCDDMTGAMDLISASTSPVIDDDETTQPTLLPVSFNFFGVPHPYASVQTNGMVQFHTSSTGLASTAYSNAATVPSTSTPNGFAAPYWDDLYRSGATGEAVTMKVLATGGSRVTVEWVNPLGAGTNFQAKFFSSTGVIEYHYCNIGIETGSSATIGVENSGGTVGSQWSNGAATSAGVRFTYVP